MEYNKIQDKWDQDSNRTILNKKIIYPIMDLYGVITETDLIDNEVSFVILLADDTAIADVYTVFLNGIKRYSRTIEDGDNVSGKLSDHLNITKNNTPDGVYLSIYTIHDFSTNKSVSFTALLLIDRVPTHCVDLSQPIFENKNTNGCIDISSIIKNHGIDIKIPPYTATKDNDKGMLFFNGYSNENVNTSISLELPFSIKPNEQTIHIESDNIIPLGNGRCDTYYTVGNHFSSIQNVRLDIETEATTLPYPTYKDMDSLTGEIATESILTHGNITVYIDYSLMSVGDRITYNWAAYDFFGSPIEGIHGSNTFNVELVHKQIQYIEMNNLLPNLSCVLHAWYSVYQGESTYLSEQSKSWIDLNSEIINKDLPYPIFSHSFHHKLIIEDVITEDSSPLFIPPIAFTVGDTVNIYISGLNESGDIISDAKYQDTVSVTDINKDNLVFLIPATILLKVGENGIINASYMVMSPENVKNFSLSTIVSITMITELTSYEMVMQLSQNAAPTDISVIPLQPYNQGVLYGRPKTNVTLNTELNTYIGDISSQQETYTFDEKGIVRFKLLTKNSNTTTLLTATNDKKSIAEETVFESYHDGDKDIFLYNATTLAVNDGVMVNSIYLSEYLEEIDTVLVTLSSKTAEFISGESDAKEFTFINGVTTIEIKNSVAEKVEVMISASDKTQTIAIEFVHKNIGEGYDTKER